MLGPYAWRLHAKEGPQLCYGDRGAGFGSRRQAMRHAEREHAGDFCRIENVETGEAWRRGAAGWVMDQGPREKQDKKGLRGD